MKWTVSLVSFAFAALTSEGAYALPRKGQVLAQPDVTAFMLDASAGYDFTGIVKLNNCSGSLVRFETSKPTDKGLVLTNGHCVSLPSGDFIPPNQFLVNKTVSNRSFRFLKASGDLATGSVASTKIVYATMTGTDLALYELTSTYKEIEDKFDVDALTIASERSVVNTNIEILSGYWQRGYSCHIDGFVFQMKEDAYVWSDSIRYSSDGCKTIHGTSGSPVLDAATNKVVAINNTGNDDGERCTMNNPCEVAEDGTVTFKKGLSYAQQTHIIYSCLNDANAIDLSKSGCKLFH